MKGVVITYNDAPAMGLKWHDKPVVALLTTIHNDSLISKSRWKKGCGSQQVIQKPSCIDEYNSYMGGVTRLVTATILWLTYCVEEVVEPCVFSHA